MFSAAKSSALWSNPMSDIWFLSPARGVRGKDCQETIDLPFQQWPHQKASCLLHRGRTDDVTRESGMEDECARCSQKGHPRGPQHCWRGNRDTSQEHQGSRSLGTQTPIAPQYLPSMFIPPTSRVCNVSLFSAWIWMRCGSSTWQRAKPPGACNPSLMRG